MRIILTAGAEVLRSCYAFSLIIRVLRSAIGLCAVSITATYFPNSPTRDALCRRLGDLSPSLSRLSCSSMLKLTRGSVSVCPINYRSNNTTAVCVAHLPIKSPLRIFDEDQEQKGHKSLHPVSELNSHYCWSHLPNLWWHYLTRDARLPAAVPSSLPSTQSIIFDQILLFVSLRTAWRTLLRPWSDLAMRELVMQGIVGNGQTYNYI